MTQIFYPESGYCSTKNSCPEKKKKKHKLFYYSNDSKSGTCGFSKLKKICKAGDRSKFSSLCEEKRNWADSIPKKLKMRSIDCIVLRLVLCIIGVACKNKPSFQGLWPHGKDSNIARDLQLSLGSYILIPQSYVL